MMFVESMFERSSSFAYVDKLCTFFTSNFVYNTTCVTVHGRIYVVARLLHNGFSAFFGFQKFGFKGPTRRPQFFKNSQINLQVFA